MNDNVNIDDLAKSIKASVQTNIDLIKLEAVERTSVLGSSTSVILIVGFFVFLSVFFLSLFAGFYLSICYDNTYTGFGLVAGFYFLLSLVLILFRKRLIEAPMRDKIIRSILKK